MVSLDRVPFAQNDCRDFPRWGTKDTTAPQKNSRVRSAPIMKRLCWGLLVLFASVTPIGAAPAGAAPADFPAADFSGYSSGAAIHAGLLQAATEGPRLVDTEVAFSGAAVASQGFKGAIHDELKQAVLP